MQRSQVLADMALYIIGVSAIWALLYIIGILANAIEIPIYITRCLRKCDLSTPIYKESDAGLRPLKKNFSGYLVVSKSCCTFAFATPKKGWSEVSDTRLEVGGDDS